jgi:putative ABC transport system permease protein
MGNQTTVQYTIIGVVKNFHFASLRQNIGALCLTLGRSTAHISFRMSTDNIGAVVSTLERQWKAMAPGQPFSYSFLDESFNAMYRTEQRVGQIAITFSVLAVCIACLGLFGLAAYTAEQRTKEIGIRKVLGASVGQLVALLSADFLKLVLIAFVIAVPIAGYIMHRWLEDFAYRIALEWWVFGLAGLAALLIAFLTVSLQSVKAALTNPVKSLRSE